MELTAADTRGMQQSYTLVMYLVFWATLMRALLVRAKVLPPSCAHCGLPFERRALGERVCRCS
jgi:hypothetical protein